MKKEFFCIFLLIILHNFSKAQEHTHRFYTVYDGIPQSQLQYITQDSTGYIWIATKGGVARFDGIKFESFTSKDGLTKDFIIQILPTDSCIWFLANNGISKYEKGKFTPYHFDGNNITYCGQFNAKMIFYEYPDKNWQFENGKFKPADLYIINKPIVITKVENIGKDSLFILDSKSKLYYIKDTESIVIDSVYSFSINTNLNQLFYNKITKNGPEPTLYNWKTKQITQIEEFKNNADSWFYINSKSNTIAVWTRNSVGYMVNDSAIYLQKEFNQVSYVFIDNQKNIWVADENGLYCFNKLEFTEFTKTNSQIISYVWDIKEFPKETYYFASYSNGLQRYKNGIFSKQRTTNNSYGKEINTFYFNTPPAKDTVMILNHSEGVLKFDGKTFSPLIKEIEKYNAALVTFYDSLKKQYLVGCAPEKLYIGDGKTPSKIYNSSDTTFKKNILAISYDSNNDICIGNQGLTKFKNGKFVKYPNIPDSVQFRVFSLQKDHKGNLWIGTERGLWFYNYDTIFQINTKYFTGYITFLQMVDTTWLMGGTTLGLPLLYLPDFYKNGFQKVKYYDRYNGFTGRDCGQNGTLHDSKNTFWIPTIDRVLRFDPTKIEFNTKPPTVIIKGISLLGEDLSWTFIGDSIHKLGHDQNGLKFSYIGLNYSAPERVRYKYRLVGFGNAWSEETPEREVIFTNLSPGKYTFELLACNEDEYWTKHPAQFNFMITPAWYQRLTVKLGFIILFTVILTWIIILIMKKRNADKRKKLEFEIALQKEELEKQNYQKLYNESQLNIINEKLKGQDEERTRIARELHDGIGGNLIGLKLLMEQACEKQNHKDISGLVNIVSNTLEEVRTISHNLMPPEFSGIKLNQVLQLHIEKLNKASKTHFNIQFLPQKGWESIPENIQVEIYRILQELCSNTLKYSDATEVNLQLSKFDESINILMEDNGAPFDYAKNGIGYRNINERLQLLNGTFEKSSAKNAGNHHHIQIPLNFINFKQDE